MDKDELKERIRVPLLGFSAVLMSIVAFLLLLYGITVVVRFLFALVAWIAMAYTSRKNNVFECGGQHFVFGCGERHLAFKCGGQRAVPTSARRIFGKAGQ